MEREYDLFERLPHGAVIWRGRGSGLKHASLKLEQIAKATPNECFAIHIPSREVVACLNPRAANGGGAKFVLFQIAYDETLASLRTDLLKRRGYEVVTVLGNEAAKTVLSLPQYCDLFIVGDQAPQETRQEIVAWLRERYPSVPIVALNAADGRELGSADYNVVSHGADAWLSTISTALN